MNHIHKRIGVIGGGQLAQMLAKAAESLGIEVVALVNNQDCPAQHVAKLFIGNQNNKADITRFSKEIDLLTFEFENVNLLLLEDLSLPIYPNLHSLKIAQDRELEKQAFVANKIPTTHFKIANDFYTCQQALEQIGLPAIIKTCRDGYDGKGQAVIYERNDFEKVWIQFDGKRVIVENLIKFERELSLISIRAKNGEVRFYPLVENQHQSGILRLSKAPYMNMNLQKLAEEYASCLLTSLNYVGVLTIEFFQKGKKLIANEMAPRVHNSGHWTIEGAHTSQFENHIRAIICGLPLGSTASRGYSAMINFIGAIPPLEKILAVKNIHFHAYHKTPFPNRKLGHATICADSEAEREQILKSFLEEKK